MVVEGEDMEENNSKQGMLLGVEYHPQKQKKRDGKILVALTEIFQVRQFIFCFFVFFFFVFLFIFFSSFSSTRQKNVADFD